MKMIDKKLPNNDVEITDVTAWHWGNWKTPVQRPVWLHRKLR